MMKNILSLTALASMASAYSYTVAQLESMEETATPIRLAINPLNDYENRITIKLGKD